MSADKFLVAIPLKRGKSSTDYGYEDEVQEVRRNPLEAGQKFNRFRMTPEL